ncbi:MAG: DUF2784 domain-containing protein [Candidatus Methylomirabilales bacterium]
MWYRLLADLTLVTHLAFVLFVVFGGVLVLRWPALVALHLPAVGWGIYLEVAGAICPLTPLENHFRRLAGESGYHGGFIEHYLMPLLYPPELTHEGQLVLAALVIVINLALYGAMLWCWRRTRRGPASSAFPRP